MTCGTAPVSPGTELYIWYEADPDRADAVLQAFAHLQQMMGPSTPSRLLRRSDLVLREGVLRDTWMEIWVLAPGTDPQGFQIGLLRAASEAGLNDLARNGRHVERFADPSGRSA